MLRDSAASVYSDVSHVHTNTEVRPPLPSPFLNIKSEPNIAKPCQKPCQTMPKSLPNRANNLAKPCQKHCQTMPKSLHKVCKNCTKNSPNIFPIIAKLCQKTLPNVAKYISKHIAGPCQIPCQTLLKHA